jgi:O-acetyl-ADP-ribose deacetylase (regulator of RNase III)
VGTRALAAGLRVAADRPPGRARVVRGDITTLDVDAIVNAANSALAGGGGVDAAIHAAAGPELMAETRRRFPEGCPTGSAVTTGGGRLRARMVIHAVGPVWHGGGRGEEALLASAWRSALAEAVAHGARSVAVPSISTGVYGFPVERAAGVAAAEVARVLAAPGAEALEVIVCTFSAADEAAYRRAFGAAPA